MHEIFLLFFHLGPYNPDFIYRLLFAFSFPFISLTIFNAAPRLLFVVSKYMCENSLLACPLIVRAWIPWLIVPPYPIVSLCF